MTRRLRLRPLIPVSLGSCGQLARLPPIAVFSLALIIGGVRAMAAEGEPPAAPAPMSTKPVAPPSPVPPAADPSPATQPPTASEPAESDDLPLRPAGSSEVVVFCDVAREFAEPVIAAFEERTKIKVRPVFPKGDDRPVDAAARVIAEHQAGRHTFDIWWSGELCRTMALSRAGLLEPCQSESGEKHAGEEGWPKALRAEDHTWYGIGRTLKVIAYHTMLVEPKDLPPDLFGLADKAWEGRIGIANPEQGSTRSLLAAIHSLDDGQSLARWLAGLQSNRVRIFASEEELEAALARGQVAVAVTDSGAVIAGARRREPLRFRVIAGTRLLEAGKVEETGTIRFATGPVQAVQAVGVFKSAPNRDNGFLFLDYLLCNEVAEILASAPGELIRHGPHSSTGFDRWCDGFPRGGRPPLVLVPMDGLDAASLARHDEPAMALWRKHFPPANPPINEPAKTP